MIIESNNKLKVIQKYQICYSNPLCLKVGDKIHFFEKDVPKKWSGWNGVVTSRATKVGYQLKDAKNYEKNFANYEVIQLLSHHLPWLYPEGEVESFLRDVALPQ